MMCRKRLLPFFLLLSLFLAGCGGGGGGGGSNAGGPSEIAYVLSEDASASNKGYIVEYGLDPATNNFQPAASGPVSTGGDAPLQLLFNTAHSLAFALNNNNATDSSPTAGSVSVFSDGSDGLSASPVSTLSTGSNSVHMSLDPGGNYLVVADHGDGTGSNSGGGDVEIFSYSTSGTLSLLKETSSPCTDPFRVVFRPGSSGATSDTVYVVCSSPELVWETTPPTTEILSCSITTLLSSSPSCTSIALLFASASSALVDFTFDPSGQYAVGPGTTSAKNGFLLVCVSSSSTLTCPNPIPAISSSWIPSGNIAFSGSGNGEKVYIGNYDPTGSSGNSLTDSFVTCTLSNSLTNPASSCSNLYALSYPGPISMAVDPASNSLFIAATVTAINGAYTAATPGTSTGGTAPSSGYLYSCPISSLTSCSSPQPTGGWPVELSFDPNGSYLFVPTLSGDVDIFTGVSSGNLSLFQQVSPGYTPISVSVH